MPKNNDYVIAFWVKAGVLIIQLVSKTEFWGKIQISDMNSKCQKQMQVIAKCC